VDCGELSGAVKPCKCCLNRVYQYKPADTVPIYQLQVGRVQKPLDTHGTLYDVMARIG